MDKIGLKGHVKYLKFTSLLTEESEDQGISINNEFFFNRDGMISEQRQYSPSEISQVFVFSYDNSNRLISKDYFNSSNELVMKSKFENILNNKGKITRQLEFRAINNSLTDSSKVAYQKTPHEIMEFSYNQKGELIKMTHVQSVLGPDFPKSIIEYKNGIMDRLMSVDSDGNVISSSDLVCLEFDKIGNCIKFKTKAKSSTEVYTNAAIRYYK